MTSLLAYHKTNIMAHFPQVLEKKGVKLQQINWSVLSTVCKLDFTPCQLNPAIIFIVITIKVIRSDLNDARQLDPDIK